MPRGRVTPAFMALPELRCCGQCFLTPVAFRRSASQTQPARTPDNWGYELGQSFQCSKTHTALYGPLVHVMGVSIAI